MAPKPPTDLKAIAQHLRRASKRRPETHVAMPLPPERPRVARALDTVVRGGPDKVVDALEITKVFNLEDLNAKVEEGEEGLPAGAGRHAERLQSIPLLGSLSKAAFAELAGSVHRRALSADEILFYEGQPAKSFFIVAEGELEVVRAQGRRLAGRPAALTRAGANEVLGVFGLFSGRRRAATLRSVGPSVVLEVPGTALARLVQRHASARLALRTFYQDRLLAIFLSGSPMFAELSEDARKTIAKRFEQRDVLPHTRLLSPGEVTNGLYLVMNGQIVLRRHRQGETRTEEVLRLGRGQFFGVIAAIAGAPSAMSATAVGRCSLVQLTHRQFAKMLQDFPQLEALPARLRSEGLLVSREVFLGDTGIPGLGS